MLDRVKSVQIRCLDIPANSHSGHGTVSKSAASKVHPILMLGTVQRPNQKSYLAYLPTCLLSSIQSEWETNGTRDEYKMSDWNKNCSEQETTFEKKKGPIWQWTLRTRNKWARNEFDNRNKTRTEQETIAIAKTSAAKKKKKKKQKKKKKKKKTGNL